MLLKKVSPPEIRRINMNCFEALNGNEALNKLQPHPDIEIVLGDINMPGIGWIAVIRLK